jgi:hypothetical protein
MHKITRSNIFQSNSIYHKLSKQSIQTIEHPLGGSVKTANLYKLELNPL